MKGIEVRPTRWMKALVLVALAAGLGCSNKNDTPTTPPAPPPADITLQFVAGNLGVPVFMTQPPGDNRMFVVRLSGEIMVIKNGTTLTTPFLDISGLVSTGGEQGLLSMAFRPDYGTSGRFYVCYTGQDGDVIVARYHVSPVNDDVAISTADEIVLRVEHSAADNHNGGLVLFGPDGKLYVGIGDGGFQGDPNHHGQDHADSLGNILRIDVSGTSGYTIPGDNPFGNEVWCYGLRNPWRFSFDRSTGDLYIGDVGQDTYEEVDFATAASGSGRGVNFGWSECEGKHAYPNTGNLCGTGTQPVVEYAHDSRSNCVIGGYVYRGSAIPALQGHYFYADNNGTWLRSIRMSGGAVMDSIDWSTTSHPVATDGAPLSFAEDHQGEIYVLTGTGKIYRIAAAP